MLFTVDILGGAGEVDGLDAADLLLGDGDGRTGLLGGGRSADEAVGGGDKGAALDGRGGGLAGQLAAESLGETTRSHRDEEEGKGKGKEKKKCVERVRRGKEGERGRESKKCKMIGMGWKVGD